MLHSVRCRPCRRLGAMDVQPLAQPLASSMDVQPLANYAAAYRLRVGNYRVLFEFDGTIKLILIEEVKKRDERTY